MRGPSSRKVAVVGGGVLGVSTARQVAETGASVVLVTDEELTTGASGRSLSWLNSAGMRSDSYHRLRMAGVDRYRTLAARHPGASWLRFDGGLIWRAAGEEAEMRRLQEHEVSWGYDSRLLAPHRVGAHTGGVDPRAVPPTGALWHPGEGWVDLPSLARLLVEQFLDHGGQLVTNAGRATVVTASGQVTGVRTAGGTLDADAVVLATGSQVPRMAAELGVRIPDATPLSLLVTTKPVDHSLTAVVNTPRVSMRPTPTGSLAVDSDWTTADITCTAAGDYLVPEATVATLLAEAAAVLDGVPGLEVHRYAIGPKPVPGDGEPVLGAVDEVAGLYLAFTHSGATLALIAGELLAYEVWNQAPHPMLADFNVRRFRA